MSLTNEQEARHILGSAADRHQPSWWIKHFSVIVFVLAMGGTSITYYISMEAVASDVERHSIVIPKLITRNELSFELKLINNDVANNKSETDKHEKAAVKELEKIDKKLEKIQDLLLQQNSRPAT